MQFSIVIFRAKQPTPLPPQFLISQLRSVTSSAVILTRLPVPQAPSVDDDGGRGLILVQALSDRWGIDTDTDGKSVWVTFAGAFA